MTVTSQNMTIKNEQRKYFKQILLHFNPQVYLKDNKKTQRNNFLSLLFWGEEDFFSLTIIKIFYVIFLLVSHYKNHKLN